MIMATTTVVIKNVNNAYKTSIVNNEVQKDANGRPILVVDEDKSLLRLDKSIAGIIKDDAGNYVAGQKSELSMFNVIVRKLVHMGLEQFKMRALLEAHLDNIDDVLAQCKQWLRGAIVDIDAIEQETVNKETGEVNKTISYNFTNVRLAIPEDEQFLLFMDYVAEKGYNEFMTKMLAKKFDIEL